MALPIEKYKNSYSNWRYDCFGDVSLAIDKTEDNLYIPSGSPFQIQLLELPRKDAPSTITVWCYDTGTYFTEVATAPAQSQFRVDYPPADGKGTGLIQFNQNDATKQVRIAYKATGSPILEEFLNTKISWPDGTPTDRQLAAYQSSTQKFVWRSNPIRMFHEGNAVYHSSGENESCILFRFKKASSEGKVLLELKGAKMHQAHYTELKLHNHGAGSMAGSQPTHAHGGETGDPTQDHTHEIDSDHRHSYGSTVQQEMTGPIVAGEQTTSGQNQNHRHAISAGGADAVTLSGETQTVGTTPKTYPNAFKVYINDVDKTPQILAKAGMAALGDGTVGHAFVTTGTGEMDITDLITSDGFWEIKVTEPQNAGGRCMICLEMS